MYLTQFRVEPDGDVHLVLKDSAGRHRSAEIPFASWVPSVSRWKVPIAAARCTFDQAMHRTLSWRYLHKVVTLRGLGFFDLIHGQTGVAPMASSYIPSSPCRFNRDNYSNTHAIRLRRPARISGSGR